MTQYFYLLRRAFETAYHKTFNIACLITPFLLVIITILVGLRRDVHPRGRRDTK